MKKVMLSLVMLLCICFTLKAQNTFPTTGNVGIGTTSPIYLLNIHNGVTGGSATARIHITNYETGTAWNDGLQIIQNGIANNYKANFLLRENADMGFWTNNIERLTIDNAGNIGVGTSNPSYKLSVTGGHFGVSNGNSIYLGGVNGDTVIGRIFNSAGVYTVRTDSTRDINLGSTTHSDAFFIEGTNGNVGIGTTAPGNKLDVNSGIMSDIVRFRNNNGSFILGQTANLTSLDMSSGQAFRIRQSANIPFLISGTGNVGIGTTIPSAKLHVDNGNNSYGTILANADEKSFSLYAKTLNTNINSESFRLGLKYNTDENNGFISFFRGGDTYGGFLGFSTNGIERIRVDQNGNVGIGTTTPDAKLAVNGKIHTKEVKVDLVGWPDYVFKKEYQLPTLKEVEKHIKEKGHLKDIPSEKEVLKNGLQLGEMNARLLKKIEELTLYTIAQEKKIEKQNKKIKEQEKKLNKKDKKFQELSERIATIERLLKNK